CLLDPTLATLLFTPDCAMLLHAAKLYVCSMYEGHAEVKASEAEAASPAALRSPQHRFALLLSKKNQHQSTSTCNHTANDSAVGQLNLYMTEVTEEPVGNALEFWGSHRIRYNKLYMLAEDLLAAPASQAYVDRIFYLCG